MIGRPHYEYFEDKNVLFYMEVACSKHFVKVT